MYILARERFDFLTSQLSIIILRRGVLRAKKSKLRSHMELPQSNLYIDNDRGVSPILSIAVVVLTTLMCATIVGTYVLGPWG